jgi:hypothetical protein
MKAQDLRIGNWVQFRHTETPVLITLGDFVREYKEEHLEDYEPIPLTEEWLERLGFEKDEEYDEGGLVDYRMTLMKNSLEFVSFWNSEDLTGVNQPQTSVDVRHVHQLQNLYFALTGEELTIK